VVQANITAYDKLAAEQGAYETVRQILDTHESLSKERGSVALLVWPETVYPTTYGKPKSDEGAQFDREIAEIANRQPLVFGAFEESDKGEHNAAFFLQPGGSFETYRKSLLFPLTEYLPSWAEAIRQPWMGHRQPISALIFPSGEIRDEAAFNTRRALELNVPRAQPHATLAVLFGVWLGPLAALFTTLVLLWKAFNSAARGQGVSARARKLRLAMLRETQRLAKKSIFRSVRARLASSPSSNRA
jgi:apolipoprotein N-acyltransferase